MWYSAELFKVGKKAIGEHAPEGENITTAIFIVVVYVGFIVLTYLLNFIFGQVEKKKIKHI